MIMTVFFFNDTATTEIYTLSLHDALPISSESRGLPADRPRIPAAFSPGLPTASGIRFPATDSLREPSCKNGQAALRSEEHTSELQSRLHLVCRLLLEKKKHIVY